MARFKSRTMAGVRPSCLRQYGEFRYRRRACDRREAGVVVVAAWLREDSMLHAMLPATKQTRLTELSTRTVVAPQTIKTLRLVVASRLFLQAWKADTPYIECPTAAMPNILFVTRSFKRTAREVKRLLKAAHEKLGPDMPIVAVFDIDDTVINTADEPIPAIIEVYRYILKTFPRHYIAFVTARTRAGRAWTVQQLKDFDLAEYDDLLMPGAAEVKTYESVTRWKASARDHVGYLAAEAFGFSKPVPVTMAFGDQWWDVLHEDPSTELERAVPSSSIGLLRVDEPPLIWGLKLPVYQK